MAGFNGYITSYHSTHIAMLNIFQWASNMQKGFKLNVQSGTYNVTVYYSRGILLSTPGQPGTWNEKTLILLYDFICGVNAGKLYQEFT